MQFLLDRYLADPRVALLGAALRTDQELVLGAVHGGAFAVLLAACARRPLGERPRLIVTPEPAALAEDLEELGIAVAVLPELDRFADAEEAIDRAGHQRRVAALEAFNAGSILIAAPAACAQPVPDLIELARSSLVLLPGQEHAPQSLVDRLVDTGYKVVPTVEGRGELAVRGGLLDVFPYIGAEPYRIEFFGDQIDTIRRFDPFSQESISRCDNAVLAAADGGLATRSLWEQLPTGPIVVLGDIPLRARLDKDHRRREIRLARQLEADAEDAATLGVERLKGDLRRGLTDLAAMVAETPGTNPATIVLVRNDEARNEWQGHLQDAGINAEVHIGRLGAGWRDLEPGLTVIHDFELAERAPTRRRANKVAGGSPLSSLNDLKRGDHVVHLRHGIGLFRGMATLEKRGFMEDFLLLEFAEGTKLYVPVDAIDLVQKYVGATGRAPELARIGGPAWAKRREKAEKAIQDLSAELLATAAARLARGGVVLAGDGALIRRFDAAFPFEETEDQLAAVREIRADLARPVAMDRLLCGDVGFGKTEVAMRAAVSCVAAGKQVAVLVPTTLLAEQHYETFRDRFAVSNTVVAGLTRFRSAQERAGVLRRTAAGEVQVLIGTHAILTDKLAFKDLGLVIIDEEHRFGVKQKEKLRDICGVISLKNTVAESRSRGVVETAVAESRGRGVAGSDEQAAEATTSTPAPALASSLDAFAAVLATPRVRDVDVDPATPRPRDLATVVGRLPPHVLTLSATPIPRTLHTSLVGIREISVLSEAPAERLAVETRVAPWDDNLVKGALLRERERNGQIFVVHNRVQDLDEIAHRLMRLVPDLRLDTVHGQMDEERLARVMDGFRHGKLECLVSTSIIESGIDIPNANTLFVNNAHCFGLAELHQIRGRIGRFTRQAHAYFLTPPHRELSEEARERLNAIQEYADLGAGFKLAMRDLELRGAGNLLGAEQSGHVDAIGYELYTKLLGEAVERAKAGALAAVAAADPATPRPRDPATGMLKITDTADVAGRKLAVAMGGDGEQALMGLRLDAYIPDTWLETPALKFELHKTLDGCRKLTDLQAIAHKARDRFGAFPPPVVRLFQAKAIRLRCRELGIGRVEAADRTIRLRLDGPLPKELAAAKLPEIIHVQPEGKMVALFVRPHLDQDTALDLLCRLLGCGHALWATVAKG